MRWSALGPSGCSGLGCQPCDCKSFQDYLLAASTQGGFVVSFQPSTAKPPPPRPGGLRAPSPPALAGGRPPGRPLLGPGGGVTSGAIVGGRGKLRSRWRIASNRSGSAAARSSLSCGSRSSRKRCATPLPLLGNGSTYFHSPSINATLSNTPTTYGSVRSMTSPEVKAGHMSRPSSGLSASRSIPEAVAMVRKPVRHRHHLREGPATLDAAGHPNCSGHADSAFERTALAATERGIVRTQTNRSSVVAAPDNQCVFS